MSGQLSRAGGRHYEMAERVLARMQIRERARAAAVRLAGRVRLSEVAAPIGSSAISPAADSSYMNFDTYLSNVRRACDEAGRGLSIPEYNKLRPQGTQCAHRMMVVSGLRWTQIIEQSGRLPSSVARRISGAELSERRQRERIARQRSIELRQAQALQLLRMLASQLERAPTRDEYRFWAPTVSGAYSASRMCHLFGPSWPEVLAHIGLTCNEAPRHRGWTRPQIAWAVRLCADELDVPVTRVTVTAYRAWYEQRRTYYVLPAYQTIRISLGSWDAALCLARGRTAAGAPPRAAAA